MLLCLGFCAISYHDLNATDTEAYLAHHACRYINKINHNLSSSLCNILQRSCHRLFDKDCFLSVSIFFCLSRWRAADKMQRRIVPPRPRRAPQKACRPSPAIPRRAPPPRVAARAVVRAVARAGDRHVDAQGRERRPHLQARYRNRLLRLVNQERALHAAPPVLLHPVLSRCARAHNADLAFQQVQLSHVGADGAKLSTRLGRCGYDYRYASENVARGQGTPVHVVRSWMRSEGHRRNLLNPRAKHMGIHVGRGVDGRLYWAQMFGSGE